MRAAMEAASLGVVSINKDQLSGCVNGTKPGPRPYVDELGERELVEHLKDFAEIGLGKTRGEVLRIAECDADSKGACAEINDLK